MLFWEWSWGGLLASSYFVGYFCTGYIFIIPLMVEEVLCDVIVGIGGTEDVWFVGMDNAFTFGFEFVV